MCVCVCRRLKYIYSERPAPAPQRKRSTTLYRGGEDHAFYVRTADRGVAQGCARTRADAAIVVTQQRSVYFPDVQGQAELRPGPLSFSYYVCHGWLVGGFPDSFQSFKWRLYAERTD